MKLAQRQQGAGSDGKWGARAKGPLDPQRLKQTPAPLTTSPDENREDDPYRGKSDGEILQRFEF